MSLDGRVNGPGGDQDMSWIAPHAVTDAARDSLTQLVEPVTTVVLGARTSRASAATGRTSRKTTAPSRATGRSRSGSTTWRRWSSRPR
ncbi:hypothetical protein [Nocardioides speluncae]|uniref:hypothetical protein n=1 Tax=Nocardioides speluncae TaxID=2670337 RepID=UPI003B832AAD